MRLLTALLMAMLPLAAAGEAPTLAKVSTPAKAGAPAAAAPAPAALPDVELLKARLPAGEFETLVERTGRSDVVCHASPIKIHDDGMADCRVRAVLKGSIQGEVIRVRFTKTFGSAWPEKDVDAIFFLKSAPPASAGLFSKKLPTYRLLPEAAGLAAPNETRLAVVRLAADPRAVLTPEPPRAADMPAPDSLEGMALDAAYVVAGTVQEVSLPESKSEQADSSARLEFRIEKVLKGDLKPGMETVFVPAARPEFIGPGLKPLVPKVGQAVLFLPRAKKKGGAYQLLSPYRGYLSAASTEDLDRKLAAALATEKRLRAQGLIGNSGGHDSVRDTIKTWMDAWNAKTDIEALMACYSRKSAWRQKWESGLEARLDLAKTMATYPGTIVVVCDRVEEKDKDTATAAVRIQVMVTDPAAKTDSAEVRSVEMTFVHENSQWLILDEGN